MSSGQYGPLLDRLRGVRWPARHAVQGTAAGAHLSRLRGPSSELAEHRAYRQGDDVRRLDWRLLARSDRAYVRLSNDHAVLGTMLVFDASLSMAFPSADSGKWKLAREIGVGLAAAAHSGGDPVGFVIVGGQAAVRIPPRTRAGIVGEFARTLDSMVCAGSSPLAPVVAREKGAPRLCIITDLLGDADDMLAVGKTLVAAGGEIYLVHVVATEELEPSRQPTLATDPEVPDTRRVLADATRRDYLEAFAAWREVVAREWRSAGASYSLVTTNEPADRAVRRIAVAGGG